MWIKQLLADDLRALINHPSLILCDNAGTIFMSKNLLISTCSKHIALDFHFIRKQVESGQLEDLLHLLC